MDACDRAGIVRQRAHPPPLRNDPSKETIRRTAIVEASAQEPPRQKAQGVVITAARRQAVIAAPIINVVFAGNVYTGL